MPRYYRTVLFLSKRLAAAKRHRYVFTWSGQRAKQKIGAMSHALILLSPQSSRLGGPAQSNVNSLAKIDLQAPCLVSPAENPGGRNKSMNRTYKFRCLQEGHTSERTKRAKGTMIGNARHQSQLATVLLRR